MDHCDISCFNVTSGLKTCKHITPDPLNLPTFDIHINQKHVELFTKLHKHYDSIDQETRNLTHFYETLNKQLTSVALTQKSIQDIIKKIKDISSDSLKCKNELINILGPVIEPEAELLVLTISEEQIGRSE